MFSVENSFGCLASEFIRITFQRLLDEARRELARHYLLHSSRELNETAYLLGYEDANSFFRAFHQWERHQDDGGCSKRTRGLCGNHV